ncbi:putative Long-chain-fatty-acid--CoA ligase ACSBG1, partial [Basidiobolus ranarum]
MPSIQPTNLNTFLDFHAKHTPTKTALVYTDTQGHEQKITYKQYRDSTIYNSYYLWPKNGIPIKEKTVVGVLSLNCVEYCTLLYTLITTRAIPLFLSLKNSSDGMTHLLEEGEASVLVVHPLLIETAKAIQQALPHIQIFNIVEPESDLSSYIPNLSPNQHLPTMYPSTRKRTRFTPGIFSLRLQLDLGSGCIL